MTDFDDDDVRVGKQVEDAFANMPKLSPALRAWLAGEMSVEEARRRGYLRVVWPDRVDDRRPRWLRILSRLRPGWFPRK